MKPPENEQKHTESPDLETQPPDQDADPDVGRRTADPVDAAGDAGPGALDQERQDVAEDKHPRDQARVEAAPEEDFVVCGGRQDGLSQPAYEEVVPRGDEDGCEDDEGEG